MGQCTGTGPCKLVSVTVVALSCRCDHAHHTSGHASETTTTTTTTWLTLLTWERGISGHRTVSSEQGCASEWVIPLRGGQFSGPPFGEAMSQPNLSKLFESVTHSDTGQHYLRAGLEPRTSRLPRPRERLHKGDHVRGGVAPSRVAGPGIRA